MTYGNGLMHVGTGGRAYLHHTGGMLSFSSSFHVDVASGVGAFASSTINAFAEYRPRLLTMFAVDAIGAALASGTAMAQQAPANGLNPERKIPHYMMKTTRMFKYPKGYGNGLAVAPEGLWIAQQKLSGEGGS